MGGCPYYNGSVLCKAFATSCRWLSSLTVDGKRCSSGLCKECQSDRRGPTACSAMHGLPTSHEAYPSGIFHYSSWKGEMHVYGHHDAVFVLDMGGGGGGEEIGGVISLTLKHRLLQGFF